MLLRLLILPLGRLASLFPSSLLGVLALTVQPLDLERTGGGGRGGDEELTALGAVRVGRELLSQPPNLLEVN